MNSIDTKALREDFERDGFYIHAAPILDEELRSDARRGIEQVRNGEYDTGEAPQHRMWNPGDNPNALCKIEQPQLASSALRHAIRAPLLGELAAAITGAQMVQVWWVQLLFNPPTAPGDLGAAATNVGWHQDEFYWSGWKKGSEVFTAWLTLSDVTPESGPMIFVPGSHQWGLVEGSDFFAQDQAALRENIHIPEGQKWREVAAVLPPGGVSFHHRLLVHGSHQNRSPSPRCSLAIHLRTENSEPLPDNWVAQFLHHQEICPVIFKK